MLELFDSKHASTIILSPKLELLSFDSNVRNKLLKRFDQNYLYPKIPLREVSDGLWMDFFYEAISSNPESDFFQRKKAVQLNDHELWFSIQFSLFRNALGTVEQIFVKTENISEEFSKTQTKEQDLHFEILEKFPHYILILNKDLEISYINKDIGLTYHRTDFLKKKLPEILTKQEWGVVEPHLLSVYNEGGNSRFLMESDRVKGSWFSIRISVLQRNEMEEIESLLLIVSDVTERVEIENQMAEKEELFRIMANHSPVMIWSSDENNLRNFFNQYWLNFTGRPLDKELGNGWVDGIHSDDLDKFLKTQLDGFYSKKGYEMEYRLKRYDQTYRWILDRAIPNFDREEKFSGFIGTCIDITERKENEAQIKASLIEKEILLREIHHRVKNNLQIISSLLSLQSSHTENPEIISALQGGISRIKSISLLHDMLNLSNFYGVINLKNYIDSLSNYLLLVHNSGNAIAKLKINSDEIIINIDIAIYIGIILNELVNNSIKYAFIGKQDGEITIDISVSKENHIDLVVKDNGVGLIKGFDFKNTKSLGLKLVDLLVKQLEGKMEVINENGVGYKLFIPIK